MVGFLNTLIGLSLPSICVVIQNLSTTTTPSICVVYKILSKIIVARIRPLLSNMVSPLQTAFVLGHKGIDYVIIVQEIIHSMSKKRGRSGYMAINIDLEIAYDRIEWSFIRDTLNILKFPS